MSNYVFQQRKSRKRFGRVKRGWHSSRIHEAKLNNTRGGQVRQYVKVDFEIIHEEDYKDILVPGFFSYNRNGTADPRFLDMGDAAGLTGDYGDEITSVFNDLIGKELLVFVAHRYIKGRRRERAVDFKPLSDPHELDWQTQIQKDGLQDQQEP